MLVCSCSRSSFFCSAPNSCNSTHCKSGQKFFRKTSLYLNWQARVTLKVSNPIARIKVNTNGALDFPPNIHACICICLVGAKKHKANPLCLEYISTLPCPCHPCDRHVYSALRPPPPVSPSSPRSGKIAITHHPGY